jgi:hypothetical protein
MAKIQTRQDIDKAAVIKAYRTAIRTKYSLKADEEIAVVIPQVEKRIDDALANGEEIELNPGEVFDGYVTR